MSSYLRWTKHPETGEWHKAFWIDDHYAPHHYGVKFNDDKFFDPRKYKLETADQPPEGEPINKDRDMHKEVFGRAEGEPDPRDAKMDVMEVGKLANVVDEFLEFKRPLGFSHDHTIDDQIKDAAWQVFQDFWQFLSDKAAGKPEDEIRRGY